jgi:heme oxygenase
VTGFLLPKDFFLLMNSSKVLRQRLRNDAENLWDNLKREIRIKNLEIKRLNEKDFNIEYEVYEKEIERLLKEYILMKKLPGRELKMNILSALSFINKEIKKPMGIPTPEETKKKTLLGR